MVQIENKLFVVCVHDLYAGTRRVGPFDNLEQAAAACDAIGRKGMPNSGRSWDEVYVREFAAVLTDGEWHVLEKAISPSDVLV